LPEDKDGELMSKRWRRIAIVGLLATAISGIGMVGVGQATTDARSTASSRHVERCGDGKAAYNRCVRARRALIREHVRVGPLRHNAPGCTAPDGCTPGWWFYTYG
jgi:hypothetical protein